MKWLYKIQRKVGRDFGIPNLMLIIVAAKAIVFLFSFFVQSQIDLRLFLYFDRAAILQGQVWRVLTFIFMPDSNVLLYLAISLYFYYMVGSNLEREWGTLGFNMFYLIGYVMTVIGGFIGGATSDTYLNLTLFLAFASMFPDLKLMLFFFIPVKVKYLGWLSFAFYVYELIISNWSMRLVALLSIANLLIFFGRDYFETVKGWIHHVRHKISHRGRK
jgi:hypothetical protein